MHFSALAFLWQRFSNTMNLVMILITFVLIQQHETVDVIWSQIMKASFDVDIEDPPLLPYALAVFFKFLFSQLSSAVGGSAPSMFQKRFPHFSIRSNKSLLIFVTAFPRFYILPFTASTSVSCKEHLLVIAAGSSSVWSSCSVSRPRSRAIFPTGRLVRRASRARLQAAL